MARRFFLAFLCHCLALYCGGESPSDGNLLRIASFLNFPRLEGDVDWPSTPRAACSLCSGRNQTRLCPLQGRRILTGLFSIVPREGTLGVDREPMWARWEPPYALWSLFHSPGAGHKGVDWSPICIRGEPPYIHSSLVLKPQSEWILQGRSGNLFRVEATNFGVFFSYA